MSKILMYDSVEIQKSFLLLPEEDRKFLMDWKHHEEANKMAVEKILETDHPKTKAFYDWVNMSDENRKWYLENTNKLKLVPGGIEILGDIYDLEDIKPPVKFFGSNQDTMYWEKKDTEGYLNSVGKTLPDWWKIVLFLPENGWKEFISDVLSLKDARYLGNGETGACIKHGTYLGSNIEITGRLRCITPGKIEAVNETLARMAA